MIEIERKFLILSLEFKDIAFAKIRMAQGYLNSDPERSVRVRIADERGWLTVKGKGNDSGTTRFEWEKEIPMTDALALLELCENGVVEKFRYKVKIGSHIAEVDEFLGDNDGLVVAEIELKNENEYFQKPDWLGVEVTGNPKYYNAAISKNPFKNW
mgnify:CR=1 FL=1